MIDYLTSGKIPDWEKLTANQSKFFGFTNKNDELVPYGSGYIYDKTWEYLLTK